MSKCVIEVFIYDMSLSVSVSTHLGRVMSILEQVSSLAEQHRNTSIAYSKYVDDACKHIFELPVHIVPTTGSTRIVSNARVLRFQLRNGCRL